MILCENMAHSLCTNIFCCLFILYSHKAGLIETHGWHVPKGNLIFGVYTLMYSFNHNLQVVLLSSSGGEQSSMTRNIGFRKIKLVQEQIEGAPG